MKKIFLFAISLILASCKAQKPVTTAGNLIKQFEKTPVLRDAHYGISVREIKTGKEIISQNSLANLAPASNLKLLYTLAAYDKFGKDFHFKTKLFYSGKINDGTLYGDLIFQPDGDPTFAALRFNEDLDSLLQSIVKVIKSKGIRQIKGKLKMELSSWRYPAPGSWPIEDVGNYYGTGAWEFNFRDNRLDVFLQRRKIEGKSTKVLNTYPKIKGLKYISKVTTAASNTDDESYVFAAPFDNVRYILGTIPAGNKPFRVKAGIPNPPLSFLKIFKDKLKKNNIEVEQIEVTYHQNGYKNLLWQKLSPSLLEIVKKTNDYSMNHYSEALGWLLINGHRPANGYMSKDSINAFFKQNYHLMHIDLEDASGLAPDNILPPSDLTFYLQEMSHKLGLETLLDILPHGGEDGYAKYFLRNSKLQNRVWVKSGSVSKVRNYSGIFKGKSGKYYSFSVMTNFFIGKHKDVRKAIEKLIEGLIAIG